MKLLSEIIFILLLGVLLLVLMLLRIKRNKMKKRLDPASLNDELARAIRVLAHDPKNEKTLFKAGQILFKLGNYSRSYENLELLERLLQRNKRVDFPNYYELYRLMGLACFNIKDYLNAMTYLTKLQQLESSNSDFEVQRALGILHFQDKNYTRAINFLSLAWKYRPKEFRLGMYAGFALAELGQWREAIEILEKVQPNFPSDVKLQLAMARGYAALNQNEKAVEFYHKLKEVPEFEDKATLEEAKLLMSMSKNTQYALSSLHTLLVAGSGEQSCEAGYLLGQYYINRNDVRKGVWCFQQVKEQNPDYCDVQELIRHYGILLKTPNLFVLVEGSWEYQRILVRRLARKYLHAKERMVKEDSFTQEIAVTVTVPIKQVDELLLLCFRKVEKELTLEKVRDLLQHLQRKGQRSVIFNLGPISAEAVEFCSSRPIILIERESYLSLLEDVEQVATED